ncbi:amidohydrolase family protein [Microvirga terrae]|uniref:Amidohydrolase family protein n=1 Tax=Microvirga terrae TaxID=2740529 RepID=A0ABY5RXR2_9HYPH|nr:amidohydrolase family protein [Microvirga terrae]UVF22055.1 amidohydrolase family protein [Microvirga terrae]
MRIDAHQHFWLMRNREGQWPPPELADIHRDFGPQDLEPVLKACGIGGTVLVQSLPTMDDTDFMLDLADRHSFILGVVGWVDLKGSDAARHVARLSAHPRLKSLRPMLQDIADDDWIDDPQLDPAIDAMKKADLRFDALVMPQHLRALTALAKRHPDLPIVIDHGAKPRIATGEIHSWRGLIADLAALPQVHCKLSGLLTEAAERRGMSTIRPYVDTLLELFGPERLIWGSDWPVLRLAGTYEEWLAMCHDLVPVRHHDAVFGMNAARFYKLDQSQSERAA